MGPGSSTDRRAIGFRVDCGTDRQSPAGRAAASLKGRGPARSFVSTSTCAARHSQRVSDGGSVQVRNCEVSGFAPAKYAKLRSVRFRTHITKVEREVPRKRRRINANSKGGTVSGRPMQWCDGLVRCPVCKPRGAKRVSRITEKCTDYHHIVRLEGLSKTHDQHYHFAPIAELRISGIDRKFWPEITPKQPSRNGC